MEQSEEYVIDANIVFGALCVKGFSFDLIKFLSDKGIGLYSPQYLQEELGDKTDRLIEYSGLDAEGVKLLIKVLLKQITIIPKTDYEACIPEAEELFPNHLKDIPYIALALSRKIPLWSNETRLRKQNKVIVIPTHDLKKIFEFE
jgi:predicted nucleic acid-binding protein